jgi:exopolysaccharide biosynthesis polyprenyl glycosylphosphotransferase
VASPLARPTEAPPPHDVRARRPGLDALALFHRGRRLLSALVLVVLDLTGVTLALYGALVLRNAYRGEKVLFGLPWTAISNWLEFIGLVLILVFARAGLYRQREARPGADAVIRSLALVTLITGVYAVAVAGMTFHSFYGIFWVTFVVAATLVPLLRASYDSVTLELMRLLGVRRRTVLVGPFGELSVLERTLKRGGRGPDIDVIGTVSEHAGGEGLADFPSLGALADLEQIVAEYQPNDVVMTGFELPTAELVSLVDTCRAYSCRLRVVPTTTELLLNRATFVPGQAVPLFEVRPPVLTGIDWAVKRTFDIVVAALLVAILAIPGLIVALIVRLTSSGPAIYRDRRIGVGEREFAMLKFRSMRADAADLQPELEEHNEAGGVIFKMRDDPRVTAVGRVLRRFSIDELPQLWNVLRGEMSLVGPRPLPLRDYELLDNWHRGRYRVLPGITGLWQVSGRSELDFDDLVRLDFYYVENWSIWLDIEILARTPFAVMRGRGAY